MQDFVTNRRVGADDPQRLAYAVRILTTPDLPMPMLSPPEPCALAGQVLFVPLCHATVAQCGQAKHFADAHGLDLVLADQTPTANFENVTFSICVDAGERRAWQHDMRLWRPSDAQTALFASQDWRFGPIYRIENGRLSYIASWPWRDRADRERGFQAARLGLRRLVEGR